jgi:aspartate 1-decarboxylase
LTRRPGSANLTPSGAKRMHIHLLKAKLHRAAVTGASLNYEGSLTIASDLMEAAGLAPYERILCGNMNNGERWETYVIRGRANSGVIELNGAVARLGQVGDRLTIMAFAEVDSAEAENWKPTTVTLDEKNRIVERH